MKRNILSLTLIMALSAAVSMPVNAQKTIDLFNGFNLDGWGFVLQDNSKKPEEVFKVQNGVIHITDRKSVV